MTSSECDVGNPVESLDVAMWEERGHDAKIALQAHQLWTGLGRDLDGRPRNPPQLLQGLLRIEPACKYGSVAAIDLDPAQDFQLAHEPVHREQPEVLAEARDRELLQVDHRRQDSPHKRPERLSPAARYEHDMVSLHQERQARVMEEGREEVHVLGGLWPEAQWREIKHPLRLGVEAPARQAERREGSPILYLLEDRSNELYRKTAIAIGVHGSDLIEVGLSRRCSSGGVRGGLYLLVVASGMVWSVPISQASNKAGTIIEHEAMYNNNITR
jgi:hypothetical protein